MVAVQFSSAMLLLREQYAGEEPVFAGKVTCGIRNETSGQSWPSNTVVTDAFYQTVTDRIISSLKAGLIPSTLR